MKKALTRSAMQFAAAKFLPRQGMLDVTFRNGDHFLVAAESVLPAASRVTANGGARNGSDVSEIDWKGLRIGETGDVLELGDEDTRLEIPWDRIRSVADPLFREELWTKAAERARQLGTCIRAMRLEEGQTRARLASKLGVSRQLIADVEAGRVNPPGTLIEDIARALDRSLRDFSPE